jgi:hypothetical protein
MAALETFDRCEMETIVEEKEGLGCCESFAFVDFEAFRLVY